MMFVRLCIFSIHQIFKYVLLRIMTSNGMDHMSLNFE